MNGRGLLLIGVGLLLLSGGFVVYQKIRGLRNKNAGNIRHNAANKWQGQIGVDDKGFVIFDTAENGIRALTKILKNYHRQGLTSVEKIISRYAPSNENDTASYVKSVSTRIGVPPNQYFDLSEPILFNLVTAIIKHENGIQPYDNVTISTGIKNA